MAITVFAQGPFILSGASGAKTVDFSTVTGSDPSANDIVHIICASDGSQPATQILTSGYAADAASNSTGTGPSHASHLKRMSGTPDVDVSIDYLSTGGLVAGIVRIYRGVDTTTMLDQTTPSAASGASGLPDCPSITTVTNNAMVLAIGFLDDDDAEASAVAPSGYGDLLANDTAQASTSIGATVFASNLIKATAGAENPAAYTGSAGSDAWFAHTLALRPAAGSTYTLAADAASFTAAFSDATLRRAIPLPADAASYAVTFADATLRHGWAVVAEAASFTATFADAGLLHNRRVTADAASYAATFDDATLRRAIPLPADAASYAATFGDASLFHGSAIAADAASFAATFADATLTYGSLGAYSLVADAASYAATFSDASLVSGKKVVAAAASYTATFGVAYLYKAPQILWAKELGGEDADSDQVDGVAVDRDGNTIVGGVFYTGLSAYGFTSAGAGDIFLASYNAAGTLNWARQIGSTGEDNIFDLQVDGYGNIYASGQYEGTVDFGSSITLVADGAGSNMFVAKFNSSGATLWANSYGTTDSGGNEISVSHDGEIAVGAITGADFEGNTFGGGTYDSYVLRLDTDGNTIWIAPFNDAGSPFVRAVSMNDDGEVFVGFEYTGAFAGLTSTGGVNGALAKLNSDGTQAWIGSVVGNTGSNDDFVNGAAAARDGSVYVGGKMTGASTMFGTSVPSVGGSGDDFLVKLDNDGVPIWFVTLGGPGAAKGLEVRLDGNGVLVSGIVDGLVTIRLATTIIATMTVSPRTGFIAAFTPDGNLRWIYHPTASGGAADGFGDVLAVHGQNIAWIVRFTDDLDVIGTALSADGADNAIVRFQDSDIHHLEADAASFAASFTEASLRMGRVLTADATSYAATFSDAALLSGRLVAIDQVDYTATFADATLTYTSGEEPPAVTQHARPWIYLSIRK